MSRLLVVEDSSAVRHIMTSALQRAGYQVLAVASCAAGIAAVTDDGPFDVLILDHDLGDGFGTDVLAAAQCRISDIAEHTVFVTGNQSIEPLIQMAAPAACILSKPFEIGALVSAVADRLSRTATRIASHRPRDERSA